MNQEHTIKLISFRTLRSLSKREGGLTAAEASAQRALFGANNIIETIGNPWIEIIAETIKDPMIWFLIIIGSIFFITGAWSDGLTLYIAVLPLLLMDAFLHWRTQASTASLKSLLSGRVVVMRDQTNLNIESKDLVPGDLVVISPGTLLPADGIFQKTQNIQIDESALTGESLPIVKHESPLDPFEFCFHEGVQVPTNTLGYAGTRVLTGHGLLRVLLTGVNTSYGEIVQSVSRMPHERTPLQKSIDRLVRFLIFTSLAFCFLLAAIRVFQGQGWLDAILSAATLAVAAIPEEFPVVFTFFLGVGIYRLAKKRALVRRAVSVENIGRITQICTDKTGTITMGQLKLTHIDPEEGIIPQTLLWEAFIASSSDTDPLDNAIYKAAKEWDLSSVKRTHVFPFTEDRKRETALISNVNGNYLACMKGSPETVLAKSKLDKEKKVDWLKRISEWAKNGHKVIAIAKKELHDLSDEEPNADFDFRGILAFEDPVRPEVLGAMSYCRQNGIRVLMITGDHPDTANAIAKDAEITKASPIVLSAEDDPEKLEETWLTSHPDFLKTVDVVARCTPLQKLRIVLSLKHSGELVAVTGDGVNDVPALKAADIGIAMGMRGTRSAKEVSSIILADDNFSTIISAIREGRQLFANLKLAFEYLLLIHIPLVLTAAFIPLAGFPLVYLPVHIVWLELIIHPTALFAFQISASEKVSRSTTPNSFFTIVQMTNICIAGLFVTIALSFLFISGLNEGLAPEHARAKSMILLTTWSSGVTLYLTRLKSSAATYISVLTFISSVVVIQSSFLLPAFHLDSLHQKDWLEALFFVIGGLLIYFLLQVLFLQNEPRIKLARESRTGLS